MHNNGFFGLEMANFVSLFCFRYSRDFCSRERGKKVFHTFIIFNRGEENYQKNQDTEQINCEISGFEPDTPIEVTRRG